MNHYERLKVCRDAPLEVIRAAYRALAAKHHPDRISHTRPDAPHADMAALNAAYQVLANPVTRAAYDAEIAPEISRGPSPGPRWRQQWRETEYQSTQSFQATQQATAPGGLEDAQDSRVDVSWLTHPPLAPANPWLVPKRLIPLMVVVGVAVLVAGVWWGRLALAQMDAERVLSSNYGVQAQASAASRYAEPQAAGSLARYEGTGTLPSDEELLAEPPLMPGVLPVASPALPVPAPVATTPRAHPLDGAPLALRTESQLVDPLSSSAP
ncbi:MAG: J domain-containing protein [Rubrivivax sp.]|nr:MAG: J domain-containing protein [Rubrivivax sp.]